MTQNTQNAGNKTRIDSEDSVKNLKDQDDGTTNKAGRNVEPGLPETDLVPEENDEE